MKKIVSATDLGGAPFFKNDMREVFNSEIWDVIEGMLSPFDSDTEGLIISGCVFSNNAGNFDMTAGIVYLNGEFMRIAAVTNQAYTKYIAPKTPTSDSRTFADGSTNALVQTKEAELVGSAPGAGQYITISALTGAEDRRWNKPTMSYRAGTDVIRIQYLDSSAWNMDTDASKVVAHNISPVSNIIGIFDVTIFSNAGAPQPLSAGGDYGYSGNNVVLNRTAAGIFDDAAYNAATARIGLITKN